MKRNIFTILIFIGFITLSHAQIAGVRAGFNMANLYGDSSGEIETNAKSGYYAGVLVEISLLENRLSLQPEIVYSKQGVKFDEKTFDQNLSLDYINVPLLFKVKFFKSFSAQIGPQFGFLLSNPVFQSKDGKQKYSKGDFTNVDFGAIMGITYYTPSGFFLEARYNIGLKNIFNSQLDYKGKPLNIRESNFKNHVFSIGAGYLF